MSADVEVKRGSVYVGRDLCDRFFPGLETIVLLRRDADLLILPVRGSVAGGFILKRRNAAGDRVAHAAEFFRANGIDDDRAIRVETVWSETDGALQAPGLFRLQT